jgi:hypothetical protein
VKLYASVVLLSFSALFNPAGLPQTISSSTAVTCEEGKNCVFQYIDGFKYKTLTADGVTITVSLAGGNKYTRVAVSVTNTGEKPIDVLPVGMTLDVDQPKPKRLALVSPEQIAKSVEHSAHWANALNSMGAAMATKQTTSQTDTTGTVNSSGNVSVYGSDGGSANGSYNGNGTYNGTSATTTSSPDYAAQARARDNIAQRNAAVAGVEATLAQTSLRSNTVLPGKTVRGYVYFQFDKHTDAQHLTMPIGQTNYLFPFHTIRQPH